MISIKKQISDDETVLFILNKKKCIIPFMLILCPIWILLALLFLVQCFNNMFMGFVSFDSDATYIFSIFSLIAFIPLALLLPLSYILNQLVVTDKHIFIRKGLSGKLHIIDIKDISAYQLVSQTSRGITSYFIYLYLKSGKRIKSGNLYIKNDNLSSLLDILNNKIDNIITSRKQYKEFKQNCYTNCYINTRRNILLPIISLAPFVIALIMVILYTSGVNNIGEQIDIKVYGVVETKSVNYDKHNKISGYNLHVINSKSNREYKISVTEKIYNMFNKEDKVLIKAKKGVLGIVHDQWFYQQ